MGTYIYYCYTNEFIDLSPAFASIELYDIIQVIVSFAIEAILKMKIWLTRVISRLRP